MQAFRIRPILMCSKVESSEDCVSAVGRTDGLFTTVDGADVYSGHK